MSLHLFLKVTPLADREAVLAAIDTARTDGEEGAQVVCAAILGHKADLAVMGLARDLWTLRRLQSGLAAAGLEVADSYLSLTEVSEYAAGVPDEMKQARLYPELPPEGKSAWVFLPHEQAPQS